MAHIGNIVSVKISTEGIQEIIERLTDGIRDKRIDKDFAIEIGEMMKDRFVVDVTDAIRKSNS